jgi:uncharacterized membrane protein
VSEQNSPAAIFGGLALAGTGVAHFVKPALFEGITAPLFPNDTQKYIYVNGSIETAIGLGLAVRQTRKLAVAGLVAYGAYLAGNAIRNR